MVKTIYGDLTWKGVASTRMRVGVKTSAVWWKQGVKSGLSVSQVTDASQNLVEQYITHSCALSLSCCVTDPQ